MVPPPLRRRGQPQWPGRSHTLWSGGAADAAATAALKGVARWLAGWLAVWLAGWFPRGKLTTHYLLLTPYCRVSPGKPMQGGKGVSKDGSQTQRAAAMAAFQTAGKEV